MAALVAARAPLALRSTTTVRSQRSRRACAVRASAEGEKEAQQGTVFFKGNAISEQEWQKAAAEGIKPAATPNYSVTDEAAAGAEAVSLGQLMAFSGPAPELINGRLSMLAFVAALGAELATGEPVLRQLGDEPTGVILAAITFATASLIPMLSSTERKPFGPFTPAAEMLNGRAAMIGFAALLLVEAVRGSALF